MWLMVLTFFVGVLSLCIISLSIKVSDLQDRSRWAVVFMNYDQFSRTCGREAVACTLWNDEMACTQEEEMVFCFERKR